MPQWKPIRRLLKKMDETGSGKVNVLVLKDLLEDCGVTLQDDQFYHLLTHFDSDISGNISYEDFMRCLMHLDKL